MIGKGSMTISKPIFNYNPKIFKKGKRYEFVHIEIIFLRKPTYFTINTWNKFYKIFDEEEVYFSSNYEILCNVYLTNIEWN